MKPTYPIYRVRDGVAVIVHVTAEEIEQLYEQLMLDSQIEEAKKETPNETR